MFSPRLHHRYTYQTSVQSEWSHLWWVWAAADLQTAVRCLIQMKHVKPLLLTCTWNVSQYVCNWLDLHRLQRRTVLLFGQSVVVVRYMSQSCLLQQNWTSDLASQRSSAAPLSHCCPRHFIHPVFASFTHLFIHCRSPENTAVALVTLFPWIIETASHELFSSRKWGRMSLFLDPLWPFKKPFYLLLHIW